MKNSALINAPLKCLALALVTMFALPVCAQDEAPAEEESNLISGSLAFTSDYRFRGVTQTNEDPALQIGFEAALPAGLYAGLWASNVDFAPADSATYELDTIIGWRGDLTESVSADVQFVRYNYLTDNPGQLEYNELIGKIGFMGLTGTLGYSDNFLNFDEDGIYYNLAYGYTIAEEYNLSAAVGYYDIDRAGGRSISITDHNVGVSRSFGPLSVALNYIHTNKGAEELFAGLSDSRIVFTISSTFGFF
jgi:uncharacterized protein (TIGR02001 family)